MPRVKRNESERKADAAFGPDFLESLARGLRVIQAFDRDHRTLTLSDAAKRVDLPRASVRRTLHTLMHLGYVEADDRSFRLTPRILELAGAYLHSDPVLDILQPAVERLSQSVGEAASAAVLQGNDIVMIAHASPTRMVAVSAQVGLRLPAVSSSLGRVMLAALDDTALDEHLARVQPTKLTPLTTISKFKLRQAIRAARVDGHALVDQEAEIGFRSIAVPVLRRDGQVVAALNIGAHSERVALDVMSRTFLPKLTQAAEALRHQLW